MRCGVHKKSLFHRLFVSLSAILRKEGKDQGQGQDRVRVRVRGRGSEGVVQGYGCNIHNDSCSIQFYQH